MKESVRVIKRIVTIVAEIILGVSLLALVYYVNGIWYETNDDHVIIDFLTGKITGDPTCLTMYNSVIFTGPLSLAYRIAPTVPWYGISLLILELASFVLPLDALTGKVDNIFGRLFMTVSCIAVWISSWELHSRIQYTSVAAMLAVAGYVCIICYRNKVSLIIWAIVELLAFGVRPESMEMIQPIGIAVYLGIEYANYSLLDKDKKDKKEKKAVRMRIVQTVCIAAGIVLIGLLSGKIAYKDTAWKKALQSNDARMKLFDYYGIPKSRDVEDILSDNQISQLTYEGYCHYLNIGFDYESDVIEEIADKIESENKPQLSIAGILKQTFIDSYKYYFGGENRAVLCCLCLVAAALVAALVNKKMSLKLLAPIVGYILSKALVWGYVYYKGRTPARVIIPLYIAEMYVALVVVSFIWSEISKNKRIRIFKKPMWYLAIPLVLLCVFAWKVYSNHTGYLVGNNAECQSLVTASEAVSKYCNENKNNAYIVSDLVTEGLKRDVLDCKIKDDNYIYAGGWFAVSPECRDYNEQYLNGKDVYYITTIETNEDTEATELKFWEEKSGTKPALVDSIDSGLGKDYAVYKLAGDALGD